MNKQEWLEHIGLTEEEVLGRIPIRIVKYNGVYDLHKLGGEIKTLAEKSMKYVDTSYDNRYTKYEYYLRAIYSENLFVVEESKVKSLFDKYKDNAGEVKSKLYNADNQIDDISRKIMSECRVRVKEAVAPIKEEKKQILGEQYEQIVKMFKGK